MRTYRICIVLALLLVLSARHGLAAEEAASGGTVAGTISVWKSRVKTEGNRNYKDVIVYLEKKGENKFPVPTKHAKMDQKGLLFIPHVLAVQKGTPVDFMNNDNVKHNIFFLYKGYKGLKNEFKEELELGTWQPGELRTHTFDKPGTATTLCKLHLEMAAYVIVLDTPYFKMAAINGETQQAPYVIKNVPPGKYVLKAWHKKLQLRGESHEVIVEEGKTTNLDIQITRKKYAKK